METPAGTIYRFGPFEVDTAAGALLRHGAPVNLQEQPFRLLVILLESSGDVVSRAEIQTRIWQENTFVDFDSSLRVAVGKLRTALGDDATNPRYIETIPKRGYRFLGPATQSTAQPVATAQHIAQQIAQPVVAVGTNLAGVPTRPGRSRKWVIVTASLLLAAAGVAVFFSAFRDKKLLTERDTVVLADFANTTGDTVFDETLRQGMAVELDQSPYLSLVEEPRMQHALRLMGRSVDAHLTPETAYEICVRTASAAVLSGSISSLGSQYVLGLKAKDCRSGKLIDEEQIQVARKEDVLHALTGMASNFRRKAGESLQTVQEHARPLEEATTSSLEALKAYSTGVKVQNTSGSLSAIPLMKRAIELDPKFAQAQAYLSRMYGDIGDYKMSSETAARAYELRDQASDPERFFITAHYYIAVTGNMEKAEEICAAWAQTYPRDKAPHAFRAGLIDPVLGNFEAAAGEAKEVIRLEPDFPLGYSILAFAYIALNRLDEAQTTLQMASKMGLAIPDYPVQRYDLAFLRGDRPEMERQSAVAEKIPMATDWTYSRQASALAYSGHLLEAQKVSQRAVQLAEEADEHERAAQFQIASAVRSAFFGEAAVAQRSAMAALAISSGRDVQYGAALVFALTGDNSRAAAMGYELEKSFPEDTAVRFSYLPTIRALLALNKGEPARALAQLQAAVPFELGSPPSSYLGIFGALYPVYVRGEVLRAMHRDLDAAQEFHKILDHRGIVLSDPIGAIVHLELARVYASTDDKDKARAEYREFLNLWRSADPKTPILNHAKAEYAKLK